MDGGKKKVDFSEASTRTLLHAAARTLQSVLGEDVRVTIVARNVLLDNETIGVSQVGLATNDDPEMLAALFESVVEQRQKRGETAPEDGATPERQQRGAEELARMVGMGDVKPGNA